MLDRAHFSPGEIDGLSGTNTRRAIAAFRKARGLGDGATLDDATWQALRQGDAPVLVEYTITAEAAATDFAQVPSDRSDERRVGTECVSTCRTRWSPSPAQTTNSNSTL